MHQNIRKCHAVKRISAGVTIKCQSNHQSAAQYTPTCCTPAFKFHSVHKLQYDSVAVILVKVIFAVCDLFLT